MNEEYKAYLLSIEWKTIRQRLFTERGKQCERCSSNRILQIHHLTYERIFKEEMSDLLILCRSCHEKEHGIGKVKKNKVVKKNIKKQKGYKKDPHKVAQGKKSHRIRKEKFTAKNPVEKVLRQHKNGKYKTLMAFNTAYNCAIKRCKRFGVPYAHLLHGK